MIPNLKNWEEILLLTEPDNWSVAPWLACQSAARLSGICRTPQAVFRATKLFTSNLNEKMAQRCDALH